MGIEFCFIFLDLAYYLGNVFTRGQDRAGKEDGRYGPLKFIEYL